MSKSLLITRELTLIGLMAAVAYILSPITLLIPLSPVSITSGSLALFLAVYVLGMRNDFISRVVYFLIGVADLPVFSGFSGGMGEVVNPTGDYLIGLFFMALIAGCFINRYYAEKGPPVAGMVLGALVCNPIGMVWLSHQLGISSLTGLGSGVIPYLPGDLMKITTASFLGPELRGAVSRL